MSPTPQPESDVDQGSVPADGLPTSPDDPRIEVRRSRRRTRTVSARVEDGAVVVLMPAGLPRAEERRLVADMLSRLRRSARRSGARASDEDLMRRAASLSDRWMDGRARPGSIRWVPAMTTRWASCSPASGEIRVSEALREVPAYVLDYVVVHELAHLVVPGGHTPDFWEVVRRYPRTERAMGFLEAHSRTLAPGSGGAADGGEAVGDLVQDDGP
ncbi:M48 family metallopeptidase [Dietzia sp. SYD-A1]|uniref:M48 metallopeptidase family protein n=1 Tax=Dietzia sp. SYD-A1 TaxID=2780141 RepID=UPI002814E8CE|nr:M48 family metallopeptidase [Dietzia sp. SYD-A1]